MKSVLGVLLLLPCVTAAATISVNSRADDLTAGNGQCTLREAIANVNAAADTTDGDCVAGTGAGDTIRFTFAIPATIRLTHGQLVIQRDVGIVNVAPGMLTIDGFGKTRLFEIAAGSSSMRRLTFKRGRDPGAGGALFVDAAARLILNDCVVTNNRVSGDALAFSDGGAIYNAGTLSLNNCTLSKNTLRAKTLDGYGGAIANAGTLTLVDCQLVDNTVRATQSVSTQGGAIDNSGGTVALTRVTLRHNTAKVTSDGFVNGGGISIEGGTLSLADCTLSTNRAAGGVASGGAISISGGSVSLVDCTLERNVAIGGTTQLSVGGAIHAQDSESAAGSLELTRCTLNRNLARTPGAEAESYGGGINAATDVTLTNCTLTNNRVSVCRDCLSSGGGINGDGGFTRLTNCTLSGNTAPAGNLYGGGGVGGTGVMLTNSIVARSAPADCEPGQAVDSGGHNLISDATCFASGGSDVLNTDPQLATLGANGGPTQTMALCAAAGIPAGCRAASPAIDGGDDAVVGPPENLSADQRGFPRRYGAHVDIGAYETQ